MNPLRPSIFLAITVLAAASGCSKPITVHAVAESGGAPLADVRIYRHRFGFFNLFPGKKFVHTGPDGRAEVSVGSANTNLTMLRSEYEPVIFGVFETPVEAIAPDAGGYDHVVMYRDIEPAPENEYEVRFRAVRREPLRLTVVDAETRAPVAGADVYGATFLYLPQPGVEADWGFPPLQRATRTRPSPSTGAPSPARAPRRCRCAGCASSRWTSWWSTRRPRSRCAAPRSASASPATDCRRTPPAGPGPWARTAAPARCPSRTCSPSSSA